MNNIILIGAGAVGRSIALALFYAGIPLAGIYSRSGATARKIARQVGAPHAGELSEWNGNGTVVLLAVTDSAVAEVGSIVARRLQHPRTAVVLHCSGPLSSDELRTVRRRGAAVGSFHPMQTFPARRITGKEFHGVWIAVEGDPAAVRTARRLAAIMKANTFLLKKRDKILYHIAGVFASNYLVTLLAVVEQLSAAAGIPARNVWKIFMPIIRRTAENVAASSPRAAITGVIARKDHAVIRKHFTALSRPKLKFAAQLYASLGMETIRLLQRKR